SKIPYAIEQGIFVKEQGICTQEQGIWAPIDFRMTFSEGTGRLVLTIAVKSQSRFFSVRNRNDTAASIAATAEASAALEFHLDRSAYVRRKSTTTPSIYWRSSPPDAFTLAWLCGDLRTCGFHQTLPKRTLT